MMASMTDDLGNHAASPRRLDDIVEGGLCIGCGLCQGLAGPGTVAMAMTAEGRERPVVAGTLDGATAELIFAVCPGIGVEGLPEALHGPDTVVDPMWGPYLRIARGFAGDPEVRFIGATGGVLSALAIHLLESGRVESVLHVAASRERPARTVRHISRDRAQVLEGAGSRYGPAAPLVDFAEVLGRERFFAFIGKPCDVSALRNLGRHDERVGRYCRYLLTLICGGVSELGKSLEVLDGFGVAEDELSLFRYRGHGNPGPTRIETRDGRVFETTYNEFWGDEAQWRLQFRCKVCPDAIGESADLVAFDVWPDALPTGEDDGFNGIMTRTEQGRELLDSALRAGDIVIDRELGPRDVDHFQPHQVSLKRAAWARLLGLGRAGRPVLRTRGLRLRELALEAGVAANLSEARGTRRRIREGGQS